MVASKEKTVRNLIAGLVALLISSSGWAGFWQVDYDDNSHAKNVTTVVVGGAPAELSAIGIVDSTRYWEVFLGKSLKVAEDISITPHIGLEGLSGASPRLRYLVLTSATFGKLRFTGINEFAGNTGNFHKQVLQVDIHHRIAAGLVRHSSAGFGPRIDFQVTPTLSVYFQHLKRDGTHRSTVALIGAF